MTGTTDQPGSADGKIPALRRKLAQVRPVQPGSQRRSLAWVLRLSLARCAADLCGLPLAAIDATQCNEGPDGLAGHLTDENLLVLLDGPDGQTGAVCLDSATVTALIQQQTLGNVFEPGESTRPFTDTDAAMIAPLIDQTLQQAVDRSGTQVDRRVIEGYRFGARVGDVRTLLLALGGEDYRVVDLSLDISLGQGQGRLCFLLPELPEPVECDDPAGPDKPPGLSLQDSAGAMRAELSAVVSRLTVPLTQLSQLAVGDTLDLPGSFNETELISIDGRLVARGQLGQASGVRAVRLFGMNPKSEVSEQRLEEFSAQSGGCTGAGGVGTGDPDMPFRSGDFAAEYAQAEGRTTGPAAGAEQMGKEDAGADLAAGYPGEMPTSSDAAPLTVQSSDASVSERSDEPLDPSQNLPVPRASNRSPNL